MSGLVYDPKSEMALMREIWDPAIADDPEAFVMFIFPWGKAGTPLEHKPGPRRWQREVLREIKDHIARCGSNDPDLMRVLQQAVASGRGIGKSALVAWLIWWMMSTRIGSTTVVTANTEQQLKSRTWAELGKWHTLALNSHWFERTALSLRPEKWFDEAVKRDLKIDTGYYYAQAQLWSEENPDAFAGVHNHNGVLVIFDEASGIPKAIWTVTKGFFTEPVPDRYWMVFSNPRQNTGAFFECFHGDEREYWVRRNIDSRTVEGVDVVYLQEIVDSYGIDSDAARVEVLGQFPNRSANQLIAVDQVKAAQQREIVEDIGAPLLMGIDVARFGNAKSVIRFRRGRDARSIPHSKFKGLDTMELAAQAAHLIDKYKPDAIFVDGAGVGGGVVDRLNALRYRVIEVQAGSKANDANKYVNKRVEMWDLMRDWLSGAMIDDDKYLEHDLIGPEYRYHPGTNQLMLERKDEMEKRGLASPDDAEALALTFAQPVARLDIKSSRRSGRGSVADGVGCDII